MSNHEMPIELLRHLEQSCLLSFTAQKSPRNICSNHHDFYLVWQETLTTLPLILQNGEKVHNTSYKATFKGNYAKTVVLAKSPHDIALEIMRIKKTLKTLKEHDKYFIIMHEKGHKIPFFISIDKDSFLRRVSLADCDYNHNMHQAAMNRA